LQKKKDLPLLGAKEREKNREEKTREPHESDRLIVKIESYQKKGEEETL